MVKWLFFDLGSTLIDESDCDESQDLNLTKECDCMKQIKRVAILLIPLLLFAVLFIPYNWANQQFIVKWLGCGCIESNFNANDFTALFWLFVSICAIAISVLLSKRIPREKLELKVLYIFGMSLTSFLISCLFCQMMRWN